MSVLKQFGEDCSSLFSITESMSKGFREVARISSYYGRYEKAILRIACGIFINKIAKWKSWRC
ncbi:hypothetical protein C5167_040311 [Papaver somniferum]|uniref:Uncharacterized protein n=1 Tax=Papaver somniferum TaxID=3469 RepID=A0A4Y7IES3_PAPSO|nr:hypothetical protein C5167_040311 [Papaver somniferum]